MSTHPFPPTGVVDDATLHAYVDGQLAADQLQAVWHWLVSHPEDAQRVQQWRAQAAQLKELRDTLVLTEPPAALSRPVFAAQRKRWPRWTLALAASLLLALGATGGWWSATSRQTPGPELAALPFVREAMVAHAVYAPEVRHPVEVGAAEEAHLVQWLSRRLSTPLRVPLLQAQGFRLLGGRLLPADTGPTAQFMYEDAQGRRLTLYLTHFPADRQPAETAFRSSKEGAVESFYWVEGRFGYALSGALPPDAMMGLAREAYGQLSR
jgi:anti-sigma factor RsiW